MRKYDHAFDDLPDLVADVNTVLLPSKYAYSGGVSFAIHETVFNHPTQLSIMHEAFEYFFFNILRFIMSVMVAATIARLLRSIRQML